MSKSDNEPVLIKLSTFAARIEVGYSKALEISKRKDLCKLGISTRINDGKGGVRINWPEYLKYTEARPTIAVHSENIKRDKPSGIRRVN